MTTASVAAGRARGQRGGTGTARRSMAGVGSAVAVAALLLGGCGGGHHSTSEGAASSNPPTSPSTSGGAVTTAAPSTPTSAPAGAGGCPTSQLRVALGTSQGAAGSVFVPLVFTNAGGTSCTLTGYPGVSYVTGDTGQQVGQPASRDAGSVTTVRLAPNASASSTLREVNPANFPPEQCLPTAVRGLRVYPPGQTAAAFVALAPGAMACSGTLPGGQSQLSVKPVVAGASGSS
jgi:hypothetical protein